MSWQEGVGVALVVIGLLAGVYVAAQRPSFWVECGARIFAALRPMVWAYLSKRNTPEVEARMQECLRRGGEWDNHRKKCKDR